MKYVGGHILRQGKLEKGYVGFEDTIEEIGKERKEKVLARGIILPALSNFHTHIGDSVIKHVPKGSLEELVAPPNGYKHRMLGEATDKEMLTAISESLERMTGYGISSFSDFREGGVRGVEILKTALENSPLTADIMGRPENLSYDGREVDDILKVADGIGASSVSDWEYGELRKVAEHARRRGKMFALHASERVREDIDRILDLKPDYLVHMNMAEESDLNAVADAGIPVVICPRSNAFFGKFDAKKIKMMADCGVDLRLGTDNFMFNEPSVLDEMRFLWSKLRENDLKIEDSKLLTMIFGGLTKTLKGNEVMGVEHGKEANFIVLQYKSWEPEIADIFSAKNEDIILVKIGKTLR